MTIENQSQEQTLFEQLNNPFQYADYGVNYEGQVYIGQQAVAERLNQVFGVFNWEHTPLDVEVKMDPWWSVNVFGELKIYDSERDRWISRKQYGNDTMTILSNKNETIPRAQAVEDAKKSAVSDSLKKCASWFGVASDVFKGTVYAIKKDGQTFRLYEALVNKFNLDSYGDQKNGVVILPDSYKQFYGEHKLIGVFESDVQDAIQALANGGSGSGNSGNTGSGTGTGGKPASSSTNKGPQEIRIQALSPAALNQDGTAIFKAMLESRETVDVLVPKELAQEAVNVVAADFVLKVKGWVNDKQKTLRLAAKNSKIEIDTQTRRQAS